MMSAKKNEVAKTAVQLEAFSRLPVKLCSIKNNIYSLKKNLKKSVWASMDISSFTPTLSGVIF